ncbi:DMT family transporter [Aestuariirhabdus litorea]|uniref:DMT family transporter n=1 Tax=Aestuariirhabdus litorea TaxID=2528527 RepID=A0A3P3VM03_9GAMM|nr:DMT family transporter [Aestuariirhabdus litorea]RRJ83792.1 DMT family transporter [Aestuariirhabdus litorea]RWW97015.1 DMT family transporter [Endozoicomonadaceae bacterium GTF-13]
METTTTELNLQPSSQVLALLSACGAGVIWGTGALVVNILVAQYGFSPGNVSFWRFVIGAVVLVGFFWNRILWSRIAPLLPLIILAGAAMAGYVLLWFLGIEQMGAAVPTLIALCMPPVIVTVISIIRGQERADLQLFLVLLGALSGTVLITTRNADSAEHFGSGSMVLGVTFSLGSAFLYAGFSMVNGRISKALGAGPTAACLTLVAAVIMSLNFLFSPFIWPTEIPPQAWFLYLGIVTAALALLAFSWGAVRLSPTALTVATLLEPLTAVILSALLLGQHFGGLQWVGSILLLFSIWLLGRRVSANNEQGALAKGCNG